MERENLYRIIHKAIRVAIGQLVADAGRTEFTDAAAVERLRESAARTFTLLDDHAHHEDRFVTPLLRSCAPEAAGKLDAAHRELDDTAAALWRMFEAAAHAGSRAAHEGHAFVVQLSRYQAAQLSHMADEEELAQPALWRAYGDETLREVRERIMAAIAPDELMRVFALMLPSMNAAERAGVMEDAKASAPAPAFEALMRTAQSALDEPGFARLQRDLAQASRAA